MSALSDSFEYLCYGSTTIRNILYSYNAGSALVYRRQILSTKVNPRDVGVKPNYISACEVIVVLQYIGVYFYSFSTEINFSRQNLTSIDVSFWRLKSIPAL